MKINREGDTARPPDSFSWSGRWELNPRPSAWEADALPLSYARSPEQDYTTPTAPSPTRSSAGDGRFVHDRADVEPPHLSGLIDFPLADADAVVQPAVPLVLRAKRDRRDDRPPHRRRRLVDAISLERKEDLDSLVRGDESVAIRPPYAIFAAAGMVGPD